MLAADADASSFFTGHYCPQGPKCASANCPFKAKGSHAPRSARPKPPALTAPTSGVGAKAASHGGQLYSAVTGGSHSRASVETGGGLLVDDDELKANLPEESEDGSESNKSSAEIERRRAEMDYWKGHW